MELREILSILMFLGFIGLIFTGFPIAWVLGGLAVVFTAVGIIADYDFGIYTAMDWAYASLTVERIWEVMQNWVMVALPMFVYMGLMLDRSGLAAELLHNVSRLFGKVRGGMAVSIAFIGILLAASTGIIGASVVLLALLGMPVMMDNGYQKELACGTVCSVGTLGILIPPSIMLVMMADRLAISVGDLFMGALLPGVFLGVLYVGFIFTVALLRPDVAPAPEQAEPITAALVGRVFLAVLLPLGLILAVLGTIFFGVATPTEASGVGAFLATLLALFKGKLNKRVFREVLHQTTKTTAFIFAIFLGATAFSLVLRGLGGDELIAGALHALPFGPTGTVVCILLVTFLLGFFLDWVEITLIVLPLVAPVVVALGFDIVWFTVMFAVCLQTSFLTPPVGFALFYLKGVAPPGITVGHIYRGVIPFIVIQVIGLVVVFVWDDLVTWLPQVANAMQK
ncbi:TRAP transporter large permease [Haliangium ochraceum]|uniref:TRAP dicarboxylate transporter, DctM subunit n=1 Tax=Haliangium ochraceum (strain DSM 14365 / JCM 11303 / SMP-2) TaxID=502025 RepID=D0LLV8_HALO1|nr:TRAP transporter large permease subunit [Haliangium ochraceum]ACY15136.1 TRAP dicarboxylate transporter, DctM subunit [Haliangium ochraceum DSM 14365]